MTKNVIVIDGQGNKYEETYPKRARGLVKNGRARFVDEHTICLVCPPDMRTEDGKMSENTSKCTVGSVLDSIERITRDTAYISEALKEIAAMEDTGETGPCETIGPTAAKAQAIESIIAEREETNRRLIAFYSKVYDDLRDAAAGQN